MLIILRNEGKYTHQCIKYDAVSSLKTDPVTDLIYRLDLFSLSKMSPDREDKVAAGRYYS